MLVFGATVLASVFLVLVQQPSRESATWLLYLAAVWALLLPVTSFVQVNPHAPHAAAQWTACPPFLPRCMPYSMHRRQGYLRPCMTYVGASVQHFGYVQANSDLPPVPGDLQRLYSQSHLVLDAERSAAQR